jgi:hypothetical protein
MAASADGVDKREACPEGRSMIRSTRALERRDLHNSSINLEAALAGHCAFTHLASGRVCRLPYGHANSCRFALSWEGPSRLAQIEPHLPG